jgi:hypothetical protein
LDSKEGELAGGGFGEGAHAKAEQAKRTGDEFLPAQQVAAKAIDFRGVGQGFFHGDLAREGGEVAIADFHLDGVRTEAAAFEAGADVVGLGAQAGAQNLPVVGVLQEGFLLTDALDLVAEFKRTVVLAKGKLFQGWPEGTDEGTQVARVILKVASVTRPTP